MEPSYAVVLCTRNRTHSLARTLASIAAQGPDASCLLVVVDGSDAAQQAQHKALVEAHPASPSVYLAYPAPPSLARQRNYGLEHLPASVEVVHFLDDDVTLQPGYFHHLNAVFDDPTVGGAGGRIVQPTPPRRARRRWRRYFLLDHPAPGRVLTSGAASPAQVLDLGQRRDVDWLGGCSCAYRRTMLQQHHFDPVLQGYSLDEDLDLSYRIGRHARLVVDPAAVLIHHCAPENRPAAAERARDALVHRYWFLEKNIRHPLRKPAFWWSTLGRLLATTLSRRPEATSARKGLLQGVRTIWRRAHPLLRL